MSEREPMWVDESAERLRARVFPSGVVHRLELGFMAAALREGAALVEIEGNNAAYRSAARLRALAARLEGEE